MSNLYLEVPANLFEPAAFEHFEGAFDVCALTSGPDVYSFSDPVAYSVDVANTGDALLVTGGVEGSAKTSCSRCLSDVELPLFGEIEGYFLIEDGAQAPDDMDDDEFDVLPADKKIDLATLIRAALLLELPLVPLCDDDCLGLCPRCGANLNEGPCACPPDEDGFDAHPFAALKDFPFENA